MDGEVNLLRWGPSTVLQSTGLAHQRSAQPGAFPSWRGSQWPYAAMSSLCLPLGTLTGMLGGWEMVLSTCSNLPPKPGPSPSLEVGIGAPRLGPPSSLLQLLLCPPLCVQREPASQWLGRSGGSTGDCESLMYKDLFSHFPTRAYGKNFHNKEKKSTHYKRTPLNSYFKNKEPRP